VHSLLQKILPGVVEAQRDEKKVSVVVTALMAHEALQGVKLPHVNTLRAMVRERARRGRSRWGRAPLSTPSRVIISRMMARRI
jgi:hypothetical protein